MASFETLFVKSLNKPSHEEIQGFAIHLKVRLGDEAATTADYFVREHEEAGDFQRARMWQAVASSIKINDAARVPDTNRVNGLH